MANANAGTLHINKALSNYSVAYKNPAFIATTFPRLLVDKNSDSYWLFDQDDFQRTYGAPEWAPGTVGPIVEWNATNATYTLKSKGFSSEVLDDARKTSDTPFNLTKSAVDLVTKLCYQDAEKALATALFTAGNYTNSATLTVAAANRWDDQNSNPIDAVRGYNDTVEETVGEAANWLIMGPAVWRAVQNHHEIKDRVKYTTTAGVITPDVVAGLFEVDRIVVPRGMETTTARGAATATRARIWTTSAALVKVDMNPTRESMQFMTWFVRRDENFVIKQGRGLDLEEKDQFRCEAMYDAKIVSAGAGYHLTTVVS